MPRVQNRPLGILLLLKDEEKYHSQIDKQSQVEQGQCGSDARSAHVCNQVNKKVQDGYRKYNNWCIER